MQVYLQPEQAFPISMPQPVFEISIAYKKKHVANICLNLRIQLSNGNQNSKLKL